MRDIVSPLMGLRSPFGGRVDPYKAAGFRPTLVADMSKDYYRSTSRQTFDDLFTHSRLGNATMTDSDGLLKWGPHNLLTYSEDLASGGTAYGTGVISGNNFTFTASADHVRLCQWMVVPAKAKYTGKLTISGGQVGDTFSIELVDEGDGSDSNTTLVTIDGTTTEWTVEADFSGSSTFSGYLGFYLNRVSAGRSVTAGSVITVDYMHLYRSDLGGMAPVPPDARVAGSSTYVPTTSTAKYLPRRHHHLWNGTAWVDNGTLIETEARTNLITYSEDFTDASWVKVRSSISASATTGPDGMSGSASKLLGSTDTNTHFAYTNLTATGDRVISVYAKAAELSWLILANTGFGTLTASFDLSSGSVGTITGFSSANMEDCGNGWYRCSALIPSATADGIFDIVVALGSGDNTYVFTGSASEGIYIYGAQLEAASTPSSYIPTSGSSVTRAADTSGLTIPSSVAPWPTPRVIGDELVTNGTFDSDVSGWTADVDGAIAWDAGTITYTGVAAGPTFMSFYQDVAVSAGSVYQISFDITDLTPANEVRLQMDGANVITGASTVGSYSAIYVASSSTEQLGIGIVGGLAGETFSIDNISVKEIDPLVVAIQMKGRMTYADEGANDTARFFLWYKDGSDFLFTDIDTSLSSGTYSVTQAASGVADGLNSDGAYSPGINVPFNIASRHGSTFVNGAVDGTALTADTTPVALPDLSGTDLQIGYDFMGCIEEVRIWAVDLGDEGIAEASS